MRLVGSSQTEIFMCYPGERVALFIDGANVSATINQLRFDIDWKRLIDHFSGAEAYYYTAVRSDERGDSMRGFIKYLQWCGYKVSTKPMKEYKNKDGATVSKGDMDAHIITDMLLRSQEFDRIVFFSGDGDFCYPLAHLQTQGIKVTVVSSLATSRPVLSAELRKLSDEYKSLHELRPYIERLLEVEAA
jgi:uncharacterized LabA/DUF88 family protein